MTVATRARDPRSIAESLARWIDDTWPDRADVAIEELAPFGTGASTETFYLRVSRPAPASELTEFVVKTAPVGEGIFPDYDFGEQCRIINALGSRGALTPHPIAFVAGATKAEELQVMPLIRGDVPSSTAQPYTKSGWVVELPLDRQRHLIFSFTDAMADLHRIDPAQIGLADGVLGKAPGLAGEFAWWRDYFDWVKAGLPEELTAPVSEAAAWCEATMPDDIGPSSVIWGDSRLGNVIFDEHQDVVGICDWEMAGIGPAEWDLGYHFAHRNNSAWLAGKSEDLDGAPPRAEQIARYEARLGRPVRDLAWHEAAAGTRLAMMHMALRKIFLASGGPAWTLPPVLPDWIAGKMAEHEGTR